MTTHYQSDSRGPVEIASMNFSHLQNAYDKLCIKAPHRADEITAMKARLDELAQDEAAQS